jgi:hypothetical protein
VVKTNAERLREEERCKMKEEKRIGVVKTNAERLREEERCKMKEEKK